MFVKLKKGETPICEYIEEIKEILKTQNTMINEQEIIKIYEIERGNVAATAHEAKVSWQVVYRVLITNGIIPPGKAEAVAELAEKGYTRGEIAKQLGITEKTLKTYLPYDRHSYVVGEKTKNAEKIRRCRERKRRKNENK